MPRPAQALRIELHHSITFTLIMIALISFTSAILCATLPVWLAAFLTVSAIVARPKAAHGILLWKSDGNWTLDREPLTLQQAYSGRGFVSLRFDSRQIIIWRDAVHPHIFSQLRAGLA